ncbi:MAG: TonB-dependent receptor [Pseudomonadota bacterium]
MKQHAIHSHFTIRALAVSVAIAINLSATAVQAQQANETDAELEEVTVTGTRIRMTDGMAEPTPVTSLTTDELKAFEPGGSLAEQLTSLPQFFNVVTAQSATPGLFDTGGGSYLNMRGLNANRTLVLLDGSRVPPADKRGTVNVDNFPTALMRSVDVVTGGASAAYGADALGGVTNFVLDRDFEGLKVSVSTGMNEFNKDGKNYNGSIAGGHQFGDKLHVIASVETKTTDELYRAASELSEDWYNRWGYVTNPAYKATDPPGTNPQRITVPGVTSRSYNVAGVISGFPTGSVYNGMTFTDDGSGVIPFNAGDPRYNAANATLAVGGSEVDRAARAGNGQVGNGVDQRTGFLGMKYELSDNFTVFGQALLGRVESLNVAEHTGYSMGNQGPSYYLTVYRENPYLPAALATAMDAATPKVTSFRIAKAGNYLGEYAPGSNEFTHTTFTTQSWQLGFESELPNGWGVKASWQSGETGKRADEFPSARVDREALARDAVRNAAGAIVCNVQLANPTAAQLAAAPQIQGLVGDDGLQLKSPIGLDNTVSDCVPYNVMGAEGMSEAAWNYIHTHKAAETEVQQDFAEVLLTGEVYEGWGYGPVSFATGLTYREQSFSDRAPQEDVNNLGPPVNVPALNIRGIPAAFSPVGLAALKGVASNLHQFSTVENISGKYDVWEAFGELQLPIWESGSGEQSLGGNVAYRSSDYSSSGRSESWKLGLEFKVIEGLRLRATRSRDVREAAFNERFDKSTIGTTVTNSRTGLSDIATVASVGNPNLRPELADTLVAGFVYQPGWLDGLSLSTDWYEVEISDAIATLGAQVVVDSCFTNNDSCDLVVTDSTGAVVKIFNPQLNLAQAKVEGIDFETSYRMEPDFFGSEVESLSVRAIVGYLAEKSTTSFNGTYSDVVGGTLYPDYTGTLSLNYSLGPWSMQWQQRFLSESLFNTTWVEGRDIDDNTIPFYSYTNALLGYRMEMDNGARWSINFNVSNLFDKNPPIIPSATGGQASSSNFGDEWGRRYQLSLNVNF